MPKGPVNSAEAHCHRLDDPIGYCIPIALGKNNAKQTPETKALSTRLTPRIRRAEALQEELAKTNIGDGRGLKFQLT